MPTGLWSPESSAKSSLSCPYDGPTEPAGTARSTHRRSRERPSQKWCPMRVYADVYERNPKDLGKFWLDAAGTAAWTRQPTEALDSSHARCSGGPDGERHSSSMLSTRDVDRMMIEIPEV
jgi:propionyl-CoA synthetase